MRRRNGFTLIELLLVIAIIAILAAILFPVFAQARDKARQAACLSNAVQIARALRIYADDFDGTYPLMYFSPGPYRYSWRIAFMPYIKNRDVFSCPSVPQLNRFATETGLAQGVPIRTNTFTDELGNAFVTGSYAMNWHSNYRGTGLAEVSGARDAEVIVPAKTIFAMEFSGSIGRLSYPPPTPNPNQPEGTPGGPEVDPARGLVTAWAIRHSGGANYVYCDGHAKWQKPTSIRCFAANTGNPPGYCDLSIKDPGHP